MAEVHGVTTETVKRLLVDAGAIYLDYGLATERVLGATRDGNSFAVEQDVREMPFDGAKGPVKGARRIIRSRAKITANLIEMTAENLQVALAGSSAADYPSSVAKTHDKITRALQIADADYITNVALVGKVMGADEPCIIIINNALADGNLEINTKDQDEAGMALQFTAHFDPADLDTEPWEIRFPVIVEGS